MNDIRPHPALHVGRGPVPRYALNNIRPHPALHVGRGPVPRHAFGWQTASL